jgi:hypothetical protein
MLYTFTACIRNCFERRLVYTSVHSAMLRLVHCLDLKSLIYLIDVGGEQLERYMLFRG